MGKKQINYTDTFVFPGIDVVYPVYALSESGKVINFKSVSYPNPRSIKRYTRLKQLRKRSMQAKIFDAIINIGYFDPLTVWREFPVVIQNSQRLPFILNVLFNFLIKNELNKNNLPLKYEVMEAKNLNKYFINISSKKEKTISYKYNQSDLNSYFITNKELTENILANSEGLICDYYYEDSKRIKIILKNIQNSDFIYSKKYKNLINLSSLLTKDIKEKYIFIIRKDGNII